VDVIALAVPAEDRLLLGLGRSGGPTGPRCRAPDSSAPDVRAPGRIEARRSRCSPNRLLKRHLAMIHDVDFEAGLRLEVDGLLQCIASEDVVESMRAFAEKRHPVYRGR
jgi:hypothetical protein